MRLQRAFVLAVLVTLTAAGFGAEVRRQDVRAAPAGIVVTSAADTLPDAACPHDAKCTLRKVLEVAGGMAGTDPVTITFGGSPFAPGKAVPIVLATPLPAVGRAKVTIDGSGADVTLEGASLAANANGIVLSGPESAVRALKVQGFTGSCIVVSGASATVGGDSAKGEGNTLADCGTGVAVRGPGGVVTGNTVHASGETPRGTGILVNAAGATVGGASGLGNHLDNLDVAIRFGDGSGPSFSGGLVVRNTIGSAVATQPTVGTAVLLAQPSSGTRVSRNVVANAGRGIVVNGNVDGVQVVRNEFDGNHFAAIAGMAIDLGGDGVVNANDDGDADTGANGLANHAVIDRATQSRVTGTVGASCAGCKVELYFAEHRAGTLDGYGTEVVPTPAATTGAGGEFSFEAPPVTPGQWLVALVTDADGNTSEFGPESRVGTGVLQCGNVQLQKGWNHVGYFGLAPVQLNEGFPGPGGAVTAIYHLSDGSAEFTRWLAATPAGRTLMTLQPGESYWFLADGPVALTAGFSLTQPLPVELKAGWNDFVYFGAGAAVEDALASLGGKAAEVYRFANDGTGESWRTWGNSSTPAWARGFAGVEACGTYLVRMTEPATLKPLQP